MSELEKKLEEELEKLENAIKKELGIPVMLLEWENFDPRVYKHEEYKKRLEIFKMMMIANKQK